MDLKTKNVRNTANESSKSSVLLLIEHFLVLKEFRTSYFEIWQLSIWENYTGRKTNFFSPCPSLMQFIEAPCNRCFLYDQRTGASLFLKTKTLRRTNWFGRVSPLVYFSSVIFPFCNTLLHQSWAQEYTGFPCLRPSILQVFMLHKTYIKQI